MVRRCGGNWCRMRRRRRRIDTLAE
jgi:hypothetical protein